MTFERRGVIIGAGLILLTIFTFAQTFQNGFVSYDDPEYVSENPLVQQGLTPRGIAFAWTTFLVGNWIPLTWMSLELDSTLFGPAPWGYHTTSLLLHVATVLLYFTGLRKLTDRTGCSAMAAALFAIHPLRVESVAWISERKDVLCAFWLLLTLWAYVWYTQRRSGLRFGLFLLAYLCGLLSKPMLVTLPFLLLLLDYWPLNRLPVWNRQSAEPPRYWFTLRPILLEKVPVFILAFAAGIITIIAQRHSKAIADLGSLPLSGRFSNAIQAYCWYLAATFNPTGLAACYPIDRLDHTLGPVLLKLLLLVVLTAVAVFSFRKRPHLFVGWFWFVISLLPVIGLLQVGVQAYADRYTYVPHLGLLVAIVWEGAFWLALLPGGIALRGAVCTLVLSACAVLTFQQVESWHDSRTLWQHSLDVDPDSFVGHYHLGVLNFYEDRLPDAEYHYKRTIELDPGDHMARSNLGMIYIQAGRLDEAAKLFDAVLKLRPTDGKALYNRARIARLQKDYATAAKLLLRMKDVYPRDPDVYAELGQLAVAEGDWTRALREFETAIQFEPRIPELHNLRAMVLTQLGQPQEAIKSLKRALALDARDVAVRDNLAALLVGQGALLEALEEYTTALRLDPNDSEAREQVPRLREQLQGSPTPHK